MNTNTRRDFLINSLAIAGLAMLEVSLDFKKTKPLLSFSTLGCPNWSFDTILKYAVANTYDGIEIRGIQKQLDLTKCPEFSAVNIAETKRKVADNKLKIVDLGSSTELHHANPIKRKAQLDDAKRFIDLASKLDCPFIRVFPNDLPKEQRDDETIDLITKGLLELGDYAKGSSVTVLLESHGKVIQADILLKIMKASEHPNVGMVWDIFNMWSVTKESPTFVYQQLHQYIRHTHIKDANLVNGKEEYVLLGKGETPLAEAIKVLTKGGYKGYYSFEWEKLWHPEIQEPEIAIPDFPIAIKKYF
ncbi:MULTISPECIES: sugar phosphate isomerase/epimerase family protein [unclassified Arcicella]|uniref:sugar phosphate isomerase/epimerase family protein n=1 Tax=unclassified Arcicella TaxID=2644986 RepID=UPI002854AF45|nr:MULTISPECIES: sugar phosphate isomerase/epimerase family protein [unclassified Arcicella]MDR6560896.1 sugar phosphate isomerase/epimerase [Arcicella sp. BE51]MDR6810780.1 sugar phosphate isomerase/epimerase [Arcicella sp. BE140]MDR6822130.1 sugar phosphate isomerase/epimerase [Arcicella sp. BE139]